MPEGFGEWGAELRELAQQRAQYRELARGCADLEDRLLRERQTAARWRREAARAADRIAYLSRFGPVALLHRWFGRARTAIAEAANKLEAAKLEHDQADARLAPLIADRDALVAQREALVAVEARYQELLARKEALLREQGAKHDDQLAQSAQHLARLQADRRALERIVQYGRAAEGELLSARQELARARRGNAVSMIGGVPMPMGQPKGVAEAERFVERASRHLRDMSAELRDSAALLENPDVGKDLALKLVDLSGGLPLDFFRYRKINAANDGLRETMDRVRHFIWLAERRLREVAPLHEEAAAAREAWIEQAE